MNNHSDGSWYVSDDVVATTGEQEIGGDIVCVAPTYYRDSMKKWQANASLIAAAPDLLEALESFLSCWDSCANPREAAEMARAAIAKARGQS